MQLFVDIEAFSVFRCKTWHVIIEKKYEIIVKALHLSTLKVTHNDDKNESQLYTGNFVTQISAFLLYLISSIYIVLIF